MSRAGPYPAPRPDVEQGERGGSHELTTRITEGMTEYRCNGQVGYGPSEYLDRIVDSRPTGSDFPADWQPAAS